MADDGIAMKVLIGQQLPMGYRDDFYAACNIIGYTGEAITDPTVYFQTDTERGHITQKHDVSQNVGRHVVRSAAGYEIRNELVNGELRLVEKQNGVITHRSRETFHVLGPGDATTRDLLAQAIWRYPSEKYISKFSPAIRGTMANAAAAKDAFHQRLAEVRPEPAD